MRYEYKANHWTNGGTGLTNFDPKQFPIYEEAVRRFGDPHYIVSKHPMTNGGGSNMDLGSLHDLRFPGRRPQGATPFWNVFKEVQSEFEREAERKAPKDVEIGEWKLHLSLDASGDLRISAASRIPLTVRVSIS